MKWKITSLEVLFGSLRINILQFLTTKSRIFSTGTVFGRFCSESGTGSASTAIIIPEKSVLPLLFNCSGAPGCGVQHRRYRPHPLLSRSQNRGRGQLDTEEEKERKTYLQYRAFLFSELSTVQLLFTRYQCCPLKRHIFSDFWHAGNNGRELKELISTLLQQWQLEA